MSATGVNRRLARRGGQNPYCRRLAPQMPLDPKPNHPGCEKPALPKRLKADEGEDVPAGPKNEPLVSSEAARPSELSKLASTSSASGYCWACGAEKEEPAGVGMRKGGQVGSPAVEAGGAPRLGKVE